MKKMSLKPLQLDKHTIALLNAQQLNEVVGGVNNAGLVSGRSTGCAAGASTCYPSGNSTGCGSGSSVCTTGNELSGI